MASVSFKNRQNWTSNGIANVVVYGWIALLVLAPNLLLVTVSFFQTRNGAIIFEPGLTNYSRLFERYTYIYLLGRTAAMAGIAAVLATIISLPLAHYASRYLRAKSFIVLLFIVPLWISLLMRVFAWKIILGESGFINSFLLSLGWIDAPLSSLIYNAYIAVFVMTNVILPYVFLATFIAIDRIPAVYQIASSDAGASRLETFLRITWPLARPGIFVGAALSFLIAAGDYVTPSMVGGLNGTTIGMLIASQFGIANNWPFGSAIAILLILTVSAILIGVYLLTRTRGTYEAQIAYSPPTLGALSMGARVLRLLVVALFVIVLVLLYAPLIVMAIFSFNDSSFQSFPFTGFTLQWYSELANDTALINAFIRSLSISGATVLIGVVLGTSFALALANSRIFAASLAQSLLTIPVALPGIILGISLALVFRFVGVESNTVKVVIGHLTFVMPIIMLMVITRLRNMDSNLIYAAADLGSSNFQALRLITLPLIKPAIIGGAILGFTISFDEVLVTLFLSASDPTLPVYMWNQLRFGFTPAANAVFTLIAVVSITGIGLTYTWLRFNPANAQKFEDK